MLSVGVGIGEKGNRQVPQGYEDDAVALEEAASRGEGGVHASGSRPGKDGQAELGYPAINC